MNLMTNHPITPPPEMVEEWVRMLEYLPDKQVFSEVAQWGADQELEACVEWIYQHFQCGLEWSKDLRATRRLKLSSLKEQALDELTSAERLYPADWSTIRRALEALPND
jgi:hypothetical protein